MDDGSFFYSLCARRLSGAFLQRSHDLKPDRRKELRFVDQNKIIRLNQESSFHKGAPDTARDITPIQATSIFYLIIVRQHSVKHPVAHGFVQAETSP